MNASLSQGVIVSIRELIVIARFDDNFPNIGELLVADNAEKTILLVDTLQKYP